MPPNKPLHLRSYPINMVSLRMHHHASASGYDRLTRYVDAKVIHASEELNIIERATGRLFQTPIRSSGLTWYHRESLLTELAVARQWLRQDGQIFHFLYGENQFRYSGALKRIRKKNAIVCTYHTPENRFHEVVKDPTFLRSVDAVIVMSEVQRQIFEAYLPSERVFFVPHGIDTEVFSPAPAVRRDGMFRCMAVGSHLRDHATLAAAARILADANHEIRFDVITRESLFFHFAGLPNVDLHSAVSDEALISMYRDADLLVLPLLDATANNSVLEAMACGLPVVSTDLPGVRDYVNADCAVLVAQGDASALAEAVLALFRDRPRRDALAVGSRSKALELDWQRIAEKTLEVYDAVRAGD